MSYIRIDALTATLRESARPSIGIVISPEACSNQGLLMPVRSLLIDRTCGKGRVAAPAAQRLFAPPAGATRSSCRSASPGQWGIAPVNGTKVARLRTWLPA
jgi:hypothetical protein